MNWDVSYSNTGRENEIRTLKTQVARHLATQDATHLATERDVITERTPLATQLGTQLATEQ